MNRLVCVVLTLLAMTASAMPAETPELVLPVTVDEVWYRNYQKRGIGKPYSISGNLTVSADAIEIVNRKKKVTIKMDDVRIVSFGKMKGDVDTDWVVLGLGGSGSDRIVGIRDGKRMGYGGRTRAMYETILGGARQAAAGQFRVPEGFRLYEELMDFCTLAVPESWTSYLESLVFVGDGVPWGRIVFSAESIRRVERKEDGSALVIEDREVLSRVIEGEVPAFYIERRPSGRGMSCNGFSAKAQQRLIADLGRDPGGPEADGLTVRPLTIDGCSGLGIRGRSGDGEAAAEIEIRAVAHRDTLYLFGMRASADQFDSRLPPFDTAISSVKFSAAR